ncbi:hypothetical protein MHBO_003259 [Bonamia ostreae]|uniref:C3H1-type domain-containing protein n=1 Tax=Bonamia ostreae TaxID=126728 RepID=A0ABV2AQB2_9EUKA
MSSLFFSNEFKNINIENAKTSSLMKEMQGYKPKTYYNASEPTYTENDIISLNMEYGLNSKSRMDDKCKREMYKTEMCENWVQKGYCIYGSRCKFSHGMTELREKLRIKNFKTKPCVDCAKRGIICAFRSRCNYAHPGEYLRYKFGASYFDREYEFKTNGKVDRGVYL